MLENLRGPMATIGPLIFVGSPWRRRAVPPGPMPEPPSRRGAGQRPSRGSSRWVRFSRTSLSLAALTLVAVTMAAVGLLRSEETTADRQSLMAHSYGAYRLK